MSEPSVIVTMKHIRKAKLCSSGARNWFALRGWDWQAFLKDGVPVERFEETGDALALRLAEVARGR